MEMMEKPEYRCIIIIEDKVRAESIDEAKEIMCDIKIQKADIIAENIGWYKMNETEEKFIKFNPPRHTSEEDLPDVLHSEGDEFSFLLILRK